MKFSKVTGFATDEVAAWAKKHLVQHSVIVSDGLNCFSGLEKAGFSHQAIITGGGPDSVKRPEFKWVEYHDWQCEKFHPWYIPCNERKTCPQVSR